MTNQSGRFARVMQSQYAAACREQSPYLIPLLDEKDVSRWHFVALNLPPPYTDGEYFFRLDAPPNFPQAPPKFEFVTPNGIYTPGGPICISIGDYHKKNWRPVLGMRGFAREVVNGMLVPSALGAGVRIKVEPAARRAALAAAAAAFNAARHRRLVAALEAFAGAHPAHAAVVLRRRRAAARAVERAFAGNEHGGAPLQAALGDENWENSGLAGASPGELKTLGGYVLKCLGAYDPPIKKAVALLIGAMLGKRQKEFLEYLPAVCGGSDDVVAAVIRHGSVDGLAALGADLAEFLVTSDIDAKKKAGAAFAAKYQNAPAPAPAPTPAPPTDGLSDFLDDVLGEL